MHYKKVGFVPTFFLPFFAFMFGYLISLKGFRVIR